MKEKVSFWFSYVMIIIRGGVSLSYGLGPSRTKNTNTKKGKNQKREKKRFWKRKIIPPQLPAPREKREEEKEPRILSLSVKYE